MSLPLKAQACRTEDESYTHHTILSVCSLEGSNISARPHAPNVHIAVLPQDLY